MLAAWLMLLVRERTAGSSGTNTGRGKELAGCVPARTVRGDSVWDGEPEWDMSAPIGR